MFDLKVRKVFDQKVGVLRSNTRPPYRAALGDTNASTACPDPSTGVRRAMVAFNGGDRLKLMTAGGNTALTYRFDVARLTICA